MTLVKDLAPVRTARRHPALVHSRPGPAVWFVLIAYAVISLTPLLVMVLNSFRSTSDLLTSPWPITRSPTLHGYVEAWTTASFGQFALNSLQITFAAVALSTLVSVPAAYALSRWEFPWRRGIESLFVLGLLIPLMLAVLPIFHLMNTLGLIDNPVGLVLVYATNGIPFSIFVLGAFMRQLPRELEEAAMLDGAGPVRTFVSVMMPLVRPAIATIAVFRFVPIYNDFLFPLVLIKSREKSTISVGLMQFFGENSTNWGTLFAGLVLASLPLLLVFIVATRQIISGLTAGMGK